MDKAESEKKRWERVKSNKVNLMLKFEEDKRAKMEKQQKKMKEKEKNA